MSATSSRSASSPAPVRPAHRVAPVTAGQYADAVGMPIRFYAGPYAGKTIQTTIEEVQKPDLGRKYGQRDSRPVDPPPVVQVRMYELFDYGTVHQRAVEMDVDDIFLPGLCCAAELYPYNPEFEDNPSLYPDGCPPPAPIQPNGGGSSAYVLARANVYPPDDLPRRARVALPRAAALQGQLHGELFQSAIAVPDIRGSARKVVYFVFAELQVRLTGHFMLRYTAMHIDWTIQETKRQPQLAECWGGIFAIYPSKQHPSMRPSSELTNHLSRCGSKLHSRHKARAGRSGGGGGGGRKAKKRKAQESEEDEDEPDLDELSDAPPPPSGPSRRPVRRAALGKNYAEPEVEPDPEPEPEPEPLRPADPYARGFYPPPLPHPNGNRLPPIGSVIPDHDRFGLPRWGEERRPWDPGPGPGPGARAQAQTRLHGEMNGGGGGWSGDESGDERGGGGPRRVGWSSSHVRGG